MGKRVDAVLEKYPYIATDCKAALSELRKMEAELEGLESKNHEGCKDCVADLQYKIDHAYTLPDGSALTLEELGEKYSDLRGKVSKIKEFLKMLDDMGFPL